MHKTIGYTSRADIAPEEVPLMSRTFLAALVLLLLVSCVAPSLAWDEPDSFRGVKWKSSLGDAKAIWQKDDPSQLICRPELLPGCVQSGKVGPYQVSFMYLFRDDRFVEALLNFSASEYTGLRAIFIERYGAPSKTEAAEFKTKGGLTTTNEKLLWAGATVLITLQRFEENINSGGGRVVLVEEVMRQAEEARKEIKKGKGDL